MKASFGWFIPFLFLLFLLLLPNKSQARGELSSFGNQLLLRSGEKEYRLRAPTKSWQLVDAAAWKIQDHFEFDDQFFLITTSVSSGSYSLLTSSSGIGYHQVGPVSNLAELRYRIISGQLYLLGSDGAFILWRYNAGQFNQVTGASYVQTSLDRLAVVGQNTFLFNQSGSTLTTYRLGGNAWLQLSERSCTTSSLTLQPLVLVSCGQYLFTVSSEGELVPLVDTKASLSTSSAQLAVAASLETANRFYSISSTAITTVDLPESVNTIRVFGNRIFLRTATNEDNELVWDSADPKLLPLPANAGTFVLEASTQTLFYRTTSQAWRSTSPGTWTPIEVVAAFSQAQKTSHGWLLWQEDASSVQTSADGTHFQLNNGAWAASSKLKEVVESQGKIYVFLLNSSNNPNLYKSDTLASWSRITLPTKPTFQLPIVQARALAAGSLVELEGVVTVVPGEVSGEVAYLQDATGGIQIYLSSTNGALPSSRFATATAVGEISSSQAKRVSLDALDDLTLASQTTWPALTSNVQSAMATLGVRYSLKGSVSDIETDDFVLTDQGVNLKIHLTGAKTKLISGDTISLVVLVDWNSSSGAVEGWFTNEALTIDPRPVVATTASVQTKSTALATSTKAVSSSSTTTAKPSVSSKAVSVATKPIPTLLSAAEQDASPIAVDARAALPVPALFGFAFVALISALRGRRFRKIFISPD